ncbi:MAG: hypothetical protein GPJ54_04465 [Candidatus Heimdallarchaeota archaeon]|nr:hypothetical protein [Candidatus Heimdallarchaeota archaeon]
MSNYNFLRVLNIPQKFELSHNIVTKLLKKSESSKDVIVYNKEELSGEERNLLETIQHFFSQEEAFSIAKIEYENKEDRFIRLTSYTTEKLDLLYSQNNFHFNDIHAQKIEEIIELEDLSSLIDILNLNSKIIKKTIENCYHRIELILEIWRELTAELHREVKNFEYRGLKIISNKLRLHLLPLIAMIKADLTQQMSEDSRSRAEIDEQLREMVLMSEEDLIQELTENQVTLLQNIKEAPSTKEVISLFRDQDKMNDLIELVLSDFIKLSFNKKELRVI